MVGGSRSCGALFHLSRLCLGEGGRCQWSATVSVTTSRHLVAEGKHFLDVRFMRVLGSPWEMLPTSHPQLWGVRPLTGSHLRKHPSSLRTFTLQMSFQGGGRCGGGGRQLPLGSQLPRALSCAHAGLQFPSPPSATHSGCRGQGRLCAHTPRRCDLPTPLSGL